MLHSGMVMSFYRPNLQPVLQGSGHKNGAPCRTRLRKLQTSGLLVQTDESGDLSEPKKILASLSPLTGNKIKNSFLINQTNAVGIIGGASVFSTLVFLEKLVFWSSRNSKKCCPPFVVCNDPELQTVLISEANKNLSLIVENLRRKRLFLEQAGASCIVMPCHVLHLWHSEIFEGCSVPFLHVGDCVAKELKDARLKPLEAGSRSVRIGLIGTDAVLNFGVYQEKLHNQDFEVVLPDKATMEHIVTPSVEALHKRDMEGARNLLRIAIQILLVKAVNTVILASEEMQGLLPHDDPLLKKCINPMDALVRSTIRWASSANNVQHENML